MAEYGADSARLLLLGRNSWCRLQMDTVRAGVTGVAGHPQRLSQDSSGSRKYDICEPYYNNNKKKMHNAVHFITQSFEYYRLLTLDVVNQSIFKTLPLLRFCMCVCVCVRVSA